MIIDAHVHVLPDPLSGIRPDALPERLHRLRRKARDWLRPYSRSIHRTQTEMRHLPEPARKGLDFLSALMPLPSLLVESNESDLIEAMDRAGVDRAVVIAHEPASPNEYVLDLCAANPRLIPAVNIPAGAEKPGQLLKKHVRRGARFLKIHAAADGEEPSSPRYRALLETAADEGLPVILHTGCIHSRLLYRSPEQGRAEKFERWFRSFPETRFVLAHMNYHEPRVALDLAEAYSNLWVDTSWQPTETIGEAARRIGAERVIFATDWPLLGHNIEVAIDRIRDCQGSRMITEDEARLILGGNLERMLGIG